MKLQVIYRQPKSTFEASKGPVLEGETIVVSSEKFQLDAKGLKAIATNIARPLKGGKHDIEIVGLDGVSINVAFDLSNQKFEVK